MVRDDLSGNVYVIDLWNYRVEKFGSVVCSSFQVEVARTYPEQVIHRGRQNSGVGTTRFQRKTKTF